MITVGQINTLTVQGTFPFGLQLSHPDDERVVVLPAPEGISLETGVELPVFVYTDENAQLVATLQTPRALAGEVKVLKAVGVTHFGAFFDWGVEKDLLVPLQNQGMPINQNMMYPVYVYVDEISQRIIGATKLHPFLSENGRYFKADQKVDLIVYGKTELGIKVVIDQTHLGLIFSSDAFKPLKIGDQTTGYIKQIREDGKIDVSLQQINASARDQLQQQILEDLEAHGGISSLTDKSPPDEIYARFNVSKAAYKRALGALYKQKKIRLDKQKISLL